MQRQSFGGISHTFLLLLALFCSFLHSIVTKPVPNGPTFTETACFDDKLVHFMEENGIPAANVAVMRSGSIVYKQGYGVAAEARAKSDYTQIAGIGWCTDKQWREGTARYFVSVHSSDALAAVCDLDKYCVAYTFNSNPDVLSVLYSNGPNCEVDCDQKQWVDDRRLIVGTSGSAGYSCFVKGKTIIHDSQQALPETPFRWASVSKIITATTVMLLKEQGVIELDTKVFACDTGTSPGPLADMAFDVPTCEVRKEIADKRVLDITIRQLLEHRAGYDRDISVWIPDISYDFVGDPMFNSAEVEKDLGLDWGSSTCSDIVTWMFGQPLQHTPGTMFSYSNFGYCVLGLIITKVWTESVGGSYSYSDVVRELLLDPAGVTQKEMYLGRNAVRDYEAVGDCSGRCFPDGAWPGLFEAGQMKRMEAHGSWVATSEAMMKVVRVITKQHCKQACLLLPNYMDLIVANPDNNWDGDLQTWYGLGWDVNVWQNSWHTGGLPDSTAMIVRTGGGYAWALAFNSDVDGDYDGLMWDAVSCVADTWPANTRELALPMDTAVAPLSTEILFM